jgi:hypothetical protein
VDRRHVLGVSVYQREIGYLLHPYGGLIEWRGAEWYVGWFFCTVGIILMLVGGIVAKLRYVPIMFLVIGSIGILSSSMFLFNMVGDWMKNHWHIFRGVIWDILGIVSLFLLPFVGCIVAGALIGRRRRTRA